MDQKGSVFLQVLLTFIRDEDFISLFIYFVTECLSVTQAGVQWHSLGPLQPPPPRFK